MVDLTALIVLHLLAACHGDSDTGRVQNPELSEDEADLIVRSSTGRYGGQHRGTGISVAFSDVDGDGRTNLLVGTSGGWMSAQTGLFGDIAPGAASFISSIDASESGVVTVQAHDGISVSGLGFTGDGTELVSADRPDIGAVLLGTAGWSTAPDTLTAWLGMRSAPGDVSITASYAVHGLGDYAMPIAREPLGDFDGDGFSDLILGRSCRNDHEGTTYVFLGPLVGQHTGADADYSVRGSNYHVWGEGDIGDDASHPEVLGDVDGDGLDDIAIGAPDASCVEIVETGVEVNETGTGTEVYDWDDTLCGKIYVMTDLFGGSVADVQATIVGTKSLRSVSTAYPAGDMDGDGYADFAVTVVSTSVPRGIYLVPGPLKGWNEIGDVSTANVASVGMGLHDFSSMMGDFNGDDTRDVAVLSNSEFYSGSADLWEDDFMTYQVDVCLGPIEGAVESTDCEQRIDSDNYGDVREWAVGYSVPKIFAGDLDDDGLDDLAIGVPYSVTETDELAPGAVYLFRGSTMFGGG